MKIERVSDKSLDIHQKKLEQLKTVFPECFSDGKLDIDKLLNLCGEYIEPGQEKYKFEWNGKAESYKLAGKRSTGTLRPCREDSVNFDTTKNLYIEGDNLEVLKLLQMAYFRKVKMIYIDPPYNTGNDFVYEDDFKDPLEKYKEITQQTTKSNPETMGRFHTNWLNMMYPRLLVASTLLRDDGVIFISIDDNEVTNLRKLCDEVFGEENFVAQIVWQKKYAATNDSKGFSTTHDYIVVYQKSVLFNRNLLPRTAKQNKPYKNDDHDGKGLWRTGDLLAKSFSENAVYPIVNPNTGEEFYPSKGNCWRASQETMKIWLSENRIYFGKDGKGAPQLKRYLNEVQQGKVPITWWSFEEVGHNDAANKEIQELFETKAPFETPKPTILIEQMLRIGSNSDDIILDFFSGSATTAHAVMQLNSEDGGDRQFIMVQLPELCSEKSEAYKSGYKNICEIGKERIRRAGKKIAEQQPEVDIGFKVFKLDTSNLVKWDATPVDDTEELKRRFLQMKDSLVNGRTSEDLVYEIMLKLGIPLDFPVKEIQINGKQAFSIGENQPVLVCVDKEHGKITPEDIEAMCEYKPSKIVTSEEAFANDSTLSNAYYILRDRDIDMKIL